jgi:hypothetical protein
VQRAAAARAVRLDSYRRFRPRMVRALAAPRSFIPSRALSGAEPPADEVVLKAMGDKGLDLSD